MVRIALDVQFAPGILLYQNTTTYATVGAGRTMGVSRMRYGHENKRVEVNVRVEADAWITR